MLVCTAVNWLCLSQMLCLPSHSLRFFFAVMGGQGKGDVAAAYNILASTLSTILKGKDIMCTTLSGTVKNNTSLKTPPHGKVEEAFRGGLPVLVKELKTSLTRT